jgi:hypothetical protein
MRRIALPLLFLVFAAACSSSAGEEAPTLQPLPDAIADPALPLDLSAARGTIIEFLNTYADSGQESYYSMMATLGSPSLRHWGYWLGVGLLASDGDITGEATIQEISAQPEQWAPLGDLDETIQGDIAGVAAMVLDLTASVRFRLEQPNGDVVEEAYDFTGPATLVRPSPGVWVLWDVTRDGRSMRRSIGAEDQALKKDGVTVRFVSLFAFPSVILMNVRIHNRTDAPISVDREQTGLRHDDGEISPQSFTDTIDAAIDPDARLEGQVAFARSDLPDDTTDTRFVFHLVLDTSQGPVRFVFPIGGNEETPAPSPSPGSSESPTVSPSATPSATPAPSPTEA